MAKIVIAGRSDCRYFARAELLGDLMMKNLSSFHVHKIVKTPGEWTVWLLEVCRKEGWEHDTSPLIWRELVDRGGKAKLIGGANEFQEYVRGYYRSQSDLNTEDMLRISVENFRMRQEIDKEEAHYRELNTPIYVCITAAESMVCSLLIPSLVSGEVIDPYTHVTLRLLCSNPKFKPMVKGLAMETQDLCSLQLRSVEVVESVEEAFKNCSIIVMLDELLREDGETFEAWMWRNYLCFSAYAQKINVLPLSNVRVLVAGAGPVNFNTMVLINSAPKIQRHHIVGLSREVEGRAKAVLARKLNVSTCQVADLIIWGNVNAQRYIDTSQTKVFDYQGAIRGPPSYYVSAEEKLNDNKWLQEELPPLLKNRRNEVEGALCREASASSAIAIYSTLDHLLNGSPIRRVFSLAVSSEGWYDVPYGLVFSYPVIMSPKGHWTVVQDVNFTIESDIKLIDCIADLIKEAETIYPVYHEYLQVLDSERSKLKLQQEKQKREAKEDALAEAPSFNKPKTTFTIADRTLPDMPDQL